MALHTDMSGSFRWPTLIDYLVILDDLAVDIGLRAWIGALEVGFVGVADGRPVFAEIPGARGDTALTLLARLPAARVVPEAWTKANPNIEQDWRGLVDLSSWEAIPGRSQRLASVRSELLEFRADGRRGERSETFVDDDAELAREHKIVAQLLAWAAVEAYLGGDLESARALIVRRDSVAPSDLVSAANLERLRLRMLEDELAASVRNIGEGLG
ncbi:hypothetical protein PPSIR1_33324 [Plesiocystis pacifica SIR-1]|uniref:Uncharacterized protein n=1 Tax=Plesiocystis pacifica SIR-1 TaxID=391625 RepID=A6G6M1_9BACT|nr:hypothetical protein [Plesiocystis pacifica]EDM78498.1 hypothetical protein PPSIR1_33324 [Plesiocystis pacifica SIR-1]